MIKISNMPDDSIKEFSLYGGKVLVKFYGATPDKPNRHMYFVAKNGSRATRATGVTTFNSILDKSTALRS